MLFQRNLNREVNAENSRVEGSCSLCWSTARYHWLRSMVMRDKLFAVVFKIAGRSAVWLARLVRDQEVGGSNPLAPTAKTEGLSEQGYQTGYQTIAPACCRKRGLLAVSFPAHHRGSVLEAQSCDRMHPGSGPRRTAGM